MDMTLPIYRQEPKQLIVAREGFPFIGIGIVATLLLWSVGWGIGSVLMLGLTAFVVFFFRNPERAVPQESGAIIAPADGRVLSVERNVRAPHTDVSSTKISIFMSVFNVHMNRFPVSAKVKRIIYHAGRFFVASLDKACEHNERNVLILEDDAGREMVMVQIAGLVARRIVCYCQEGDRRLRGDRYGLIRFGSRVDLYLPPETAVSVNSGDRVRGGATILGTMV